MYWERSDSTLSDGSLKIMCGAKVDPTIARKALSHFVGQNLQFRVKSLVGGTFNRGFYVETKGYDDEAFIDKYFARFNIHPNVSTQSLHLEQWVNNEAISRGFPTPRIVHVDTSRAYCPYPFQLIEWSDGLPLRSAPEETVRKVLGQLGRELRKLHEKPIEGQCGRVSDISRCCANMTLFMNDGAREHIKYCLSNSLITEEQAEDIRDRIIFDTIRWYGPLSLLHADLSYDNILIDPKTQDLQSVIDWEDVVLGDPIFELAGLATFHPIERHSCFIDSYYEGRERPDDFEYRFWVYYLRIALAKAVHRHRFGYATESKPGWQNADDRISLALEKLKNL